MKSLKLLCYLSLFSVLLTGCATYIGEPQTPAEFASAIKAGRAFSSTEKVTVNRPAKAVIADTTAYAEKCLKVRVVSPGDYYKRMGSSSTTYRPRMEKMSNGATALIMQEKYNDRDYSGAPVGGIYTVMAEIHPAGKKKSDVDIYYVTGRGGIVDSLKQWMEGKKERCPSL